MNQFKITELLNNLPQVGHVEWLGVRPARGAAMTEPTRVEVDPEQGLVGDRYSGRTGTRHVTLIQQEHLPVIAACLGLDDCPPELLRRNIAVSHINLLALKDKSFYVGEALLEYTGPCHPCSQMETRFGPGGYNAVRGHGGITARVLQAGSIQLGAEVRVKSAETE